MNHAPIADIHAGATVPKVVYVSRRTPLMSAVKRVKKMLLQIEKRSMLKTGVDGSVKDRMRLLAQTNEEIRKNREEVVVKASGRAMEQALRVGEWFRNKEKEMLCGVEVRAGSVSVVDDIVEADGEDDEEDGAGHDKGNEEVVVGQEEDSRVECGDTTLELLGDVTTTTINEEASVGKGAVDKKTTEIDGAPAETETKGKRSRKRKRKKRPTYDEDELPEARIRWVKTVEVAITLMG
jgi:ribonuclease P/MRP protein subunit POP7